MVPVATPSAPPQSALRSIRERAADLNVPLQALWEVTQRCHQRCRHCYLAGKHEENELTTAEAKDLLHQMAELGVLFLVITGGEPLLRDDLFEIVDEARSLGFAWKLLTTGTLIGDAEARLLADRRPVNIDISLHGLEETHDTVTRTPGAFRATLAAVDRLMRLGVRVAVKMVLTPEGLKDLEGLRSLLDGRCTVFRVATMLLPDLDGNPVAEDLCLPDRLLSQYYGDLGNGIDESGEFGRHRQLDESEPLCNAGRSTFAVSPRGDIRACLSLRKVCGNIRRTRLEAIWNAEAMEEARLLYAGRRSECRQCADAEYCFYCPGVAESDTGRPLAASPRACRDARIRRELAETTTRGHHPGRDR